MAVELNLDHILEGIVDERARTASRLLLNIVEELKGENHFLREENQRLRDEINRLKGEQGKPTFKPGKLTHAIVTAASAPQAEHNTSPSSSDHSSEKERHQPKNWRKGSKQDKITVDQEQKVTLDPAELPNDVVFKNYQKTVVQDLELKTRNILFRREQWYSPSLHKTYTAALPVGYEGQFGPSIKSLALVLYYACNMTQPTILKLFVDAGSHLSAGTLSKILIAEQEPFHQEFQQEYDAIYRAGLCSSPWQQTDHTGTRMDGQEYHCQVIGNPLYQVYATTKTKSRRSILDVLCNRIHGRHRQVPTCYLFNEQTYEYLQSVNLSDKTLKVLKTLPQDTALSEEMFQSLMDEHLPYLSELQFQQVGDGCAITAYHAGLLGFEKDWPIVKLLMCDDAPQFKRLAKIALCWVHEGRHYKKLIPFWGLNTKLLEDFLLAFWIFYGYLLKYQADPTPQRAEWLSRRFDKLFSRVTGYQELDRCIKKTMSKKESLLMVLKHPEIPLHNNASELAARTRVRKRDTSLQTRTREGLRAWDTMMTLLATARKLGINFHDYIQDRVSASYQMSRLADIITERSKLLNLGASWAAT